MSTCQFGTLSNFIATQYQFNAASVGAGAEYILLYYVQNTCNNLNTPYAYTEYYSTNFFGNRTYTLPYTTTLLCSGTTTINGTTGLTVTWDGKTLSYPAFTVKYNGTQISGVGVPGATQTSVCCGAQGQANAPNPIVFTSICSGNGGPAPGGGSSVPPSTGSPGTSSSNSISFFQRNKVLLISLGVGIVVLIILILVLWLALRKRN